MKLVDFLKLFDGSCHVRVFDAGMYNDGHFAEDEEEHLVFEGPAFDVPWGYAGMVLYDAKEHGHDWEPICSWVREGKSITDIWVIDPPLAVIEA